MAPTLSRKRLLTVLQYAFGLLALAWILYSTDVSSDVSYLTEIGPVVLAVVLLLTIVEFASRFLMWHCVFRRFAHTTFTEAGAVDLLIKFVNLFLPSRLSGRVLSPAVVRHYTDISWARSVGISGVYTGLYASIYGVVAAVGFLVGYGQFSYGVRAVLALSIGLYLVAGVSILVAGTQLTVFDGVFEWISGGIRRLPLGRVGTFVEERIGDAHQFSSESQDAFRDVLGAPRTLGLFALGWAGSLLVIPGARVWLLLQDASVATPALPIVALFVVAAYSVTLLPITPGGLGVAEASAIVVLVAAGIPEGVAASVIVVDRVLGVYVPSLLGVIPASRVDLGSVIKNRRE